jgi:1-aminocyclopropane-1-carboxylate deaminase
MSQFNNGFKYTPIIQKIQLELFSEKAIEVSVLRLDLIHPQISGNKWFKLKYNLEEAKKSGLDTILTFGGAFSNHIHATAVACNQFGFKSIGVIRGEETSKDNFTLAEAKKFGMHLQFVTREDYKRKDGETFINELKEYFGNFYLIPEGGSNLLGEKGCEEIVSEKNKFTHLFCACGTGTTFKGLQRTIKPNQELVGISVLKGEGEVNSLPGILNEYHFGGYAKHTNELLDFKTKFETQTKIPLDYIYTAKLFYALNDLISGNKLPKNSNVLVIHSGGLQGNTGYEQRYRLNPNLKVNDIQG